MDELIEKIRELKFKKGFSNKEIAQELGVTITKVKWVTCKRYEDILHKKQARKEAENEFAELVKKYLPLSNSLNNLCNNLGIRSVNGYYRKIKKIIQDNNLSTAHFGTIRLHKEGRYRNKFTAMDDKDFFVNGYNRSGKSILKRLIDGGYKEYKCENCGISEWQGKELSLQVHHINGHHDDNRIENLQILCPNCHTQTDTYARNNTISCGGFKITKRTDEISNGEESSFLEKDINEIKKNISLVLPKEKRYCEYCGKEIEGSGKRFCSIECSELSSRKFSPSKEELENDLLELKSLCAIGRKYGVSDTAIKKRMILFGIYKRKHKIS